MILRPYRGPLLAALPMLSFALAAPVARAQQLAIPIKPAPSANAPSTTTLPANVPQSSTLEFPPFSAYDVPPIQFGRVEVDESRAGILDSLISLGKVERRIKDSKGFLTFREGAPGLYDVKFEALGDRDNGKVRVMVTITGQSGGKTIVARGQSVQEWRGGRLVYIAPPTGAPLAQSSGVGMNSAPSGAASGAQAPASEPLYDISPDETTDDAPVTVAKAANIAYFAPAMWRGASIFCGDKGERGGRFGTATTGGGRAGVSKGDDKKSDKDDDKEKSKSSEKSDKSASSEKSKTSAPDPQSKSSSSSDDSSRSSRKGSSRKGSTRTSRGRGTTAPPRNFPDKAPVFVPVDSNGSRTTAPNPTPPDARTRRVPNVDQPNRGRNDDRWRRFPGPYGYPGSYPFPYPGGYPYPFPSYPVPRYDRDGARQGINYALAVARADAEYDLARQLLGEDNVPAPTDAK